MRFQLVASTSIGASTSTNVCRTSTYTSINVERRSMFCIFGGGISSNEIMIAKSTADVRRRSMFCIFGGGNSSNEIMIAKSAADTRGGGISRIDQSAADTSKIDKSAANTRDGGISSILIANTGGCVRPVLYEFGNTNVCSHSSISRRGGGDLIQHRQASFSTSTSTHFIIPVCTVVDETSTKVQVMAYDIQ